MNRDRGLVGLAPGDWLLAEATRRIDEAAGDFRLDAPATREAASAPGNATARIVERARRLPHGRGLKDDIGQLLSAARWLIAGLALAGLLSGVAAASGVQTGEATIALSYAVVVLLGVPLLLLLVWAFLTLRRPGAGAPGMPGRILWWVMLVVSRRSGLAAQRRHLAAALAELGRLQGRTLMALATHAFWAAFFVGCIGWLWLRFLGLRFDFSWETTLLSGRWLEELVIGIGWLPAWLFGLSLPGAEQVQDVLASRSGPADRRLWAGYLIGALVVYGLLPRALLALGFGLRWRRTRIALDLARPGYLRLLPVLSGPSQPLGPRGEPPPPRSARPAHTTAGPGSGTAVLIGVELDDDAPWPPDIPGCRVLGRADNRRQRSEIVQALTQLDPRPEKIVALCSLARTPDRGTMAWLAELAEFAPVEIQLADASRLAALGVDAAQRHRDWYRLAEQHELELAPQSLPVESQ